jgi:hypothetical protein
MDERLNWYAMLIVSASDLENNSSLIFLPI